MSYARTLLLAIATASAMLAADRYSVTTVVPPTGDIPVADGLNNSGQVVGVLYNPSPIGPGSVQAFLYSGGALTLLDGATFLAINDSGQIAGQFSAGYGATGPQPEAALYSGGVPAALGSLPGRTQTWAAAINNAGQVVGEADTPAEAFLYSGGVMTGLGFLPGGTQSRAMGINNDGQIVGWSMNASGNREAFLYSGGVMTGLGTLPGYTDSVATAINDKGEVVGYASNSSGNSEAFRYSDGVMTALGFLPGSQSSQANAINNQGQIVGSSGSAFLYSGGQMVDLGSLVADLPQNLGPLSEATGINNSGQIIAGNSLASILLTPKQGGFVPVTPCRIADTRTTPGPFGAPSLVGGSARSFAVSQSACGIPDTATAYSLNVTVVPQGILGYLTLWPTGANQPLVSTLNSSEGSIVANAAIVPAGQDGAVSVYVTDPADVVLDIDGYFDSSAGDSFYPVQPCRVADTRNATGPLAGPSLTTGQTRDFPILSSSCNLLSAATAYSMNVTAVPPGYLAYLTTWPTGQPQPFVSTLNSPAGQIVANAALVPAGTNGETSVYVTNPTDVVLDTNGYFAPSGSPGALTFHSIVPCRVADTRNADGPFGGPIMGAASARSFAIPASDCSIPSTAAAYSLNVTVVPTGPLAYLTAWPTGSTQPPVSTLNAQDGAVLANAAIVPAGTNGAISIYVTDSTEVILDINGYFAP